MAKRTTRRKSNAVSVDFTDVEVRILLPEGIYDAEVEEVELKGGDKPYLSWKFKTIDDDPKLNGKTLYNNTSLLPQSLWVLASLLDCLGVERPEGAMDLDLEELVGLTIALQVEHEEYEGQTKSRVTSFMPAGEAEELEEVEAVDDEEDDDEDEVEVESEAAESYTEEEILAMDADELDEVVEANDLKVRKVKKLSTMAAKVVTALEEAGLIGEAEEAEEEAEEGEESELYTEEEVNEMDGDELDELVKTEELEVKKMKNIKRYRKAVIEALEEAELLDDEDED